LKEIDLIGIPHRIVISKRMLDGGTVEYKKRGEASAANWKLDEAADKLAAVITAR
jgi:prolyl-tRNA synthetase